MPISQNMANGENADIEPRKVSLDLTASGAEASGAARFYDIHIGAGLLARIADYVPFALAGRKLFVLTDENVAESFAARVVGALETAEPQSVEMLTLPAGEATKSMQSYERVLSWMLDHHVDRSSVLFTVGGGVIGDLGGFAAASIMRGIAFVQVPTTLLAQVDSAVGGKTGINMPQGKNLVGAFHQPVSVVCDLKTLETLPRRELLAGYAEIAKYGLLGDAAFFSWLEAHGADLIAGDRTAQTYAIEASCRKKAEIVAADEREAGQRALLNLGHTFGHALEAAAGYDGRLLHGEAVSIGMVMAYRLSALLGLCAAEDADRAEAHLTAIGLPTKAAQITPALSHSAEDILALMQHDKKAQGGQLIFVLVRGIGQAFTQKNVAPEDVLAIIRQSFEQ